MPDSAFIQFEDEPSAFAIPPAEPEEVPSWKVLVVDDDHDVHETTQFALQNLRLLGRPIELIHAYSAEQSLEILRTQDMIAVILLDVVMETDDAGLRLVQVIREELRLHQLRIILRTGQPGQSPELETITAYDINDYKTKSELTRTKLFATLTTALRSFDQLHRLELSRKGLEKIIHASNQFIADQGMQSFADGVITQIAGLLGIAPEGVVCASADLLRPDDSASSSIVVIAAAGAYRHWIDRRLDEIKNDRIIHYLQKCLQERRTLVEPRSVTLYFAGKSGNDFAAYIASEDQIKDVDRRLLEVFCTNISLCASNVTLVNRLHDMAFNDGLLRLPNRLAFIKALRERLQNSKLDGQALAKLDIDQFAQANETLGYHLGDLLLKDLARRMRAQFGPSCVIARLGGNTFGILGPKGLLASESVSGLFNEPFVIEGTTRRLSASVGLVDYDEAKPRTAEEFLEFAFVGLKRAKSQGLGRAAWFTQELGEAAKERSRMLQGLHKAVDTDRLFLVFQPKVDLLSEKVIGLEALLRWRDESGALVPPDRFIPVAEQSGLIVGMGLWVLQAAINALQKLTQTGYSDIQMGVNVSVVQLEDPEFLEEIRKILVETNTNPAQIEFEVTESVAILGLDRVVDLLESIGQLGIGIAIDDFGTEYSSLSYIDRLPANRIKIDRSFIKNLDGDPKASRITRSIIPLGHQLGMRVVAEGVENVKQLNALKDLGCDEVQGYYYGKPMIFEDLLHWLESRKI